MWEAVIEPNSIEHHNRKAWVDAGVPEDPGVENAPPSMNMGR